MERAERIPILSETGVELALRRYVTANALFETACVAMLECQAATPGSERIMSDVDTEFMAALAGLELALQNVVADRANEAMSLAGLLHPTPAAMRTAD